MQTAIEQRTKPTPPTDQDGLISRSEMLSLARLHNIFVTKSTIHRWSEEEIDFPRVVGIDGRSRLYSEREFIAFIKRRLRKIQEE